MFTSIFFLCLFFSSILGQIALGQYWRNSGGCTGEASTLLSGFVTQQCQIENGQSFTFDSCLNGEITKSIYADSSCQVLNFTNTFSAGDCIPIGPLNSAQITSCGSELPEGMSNQAVIENFSDVTCNGEPSARIILTTECVPFNQPPFDAAFSRTMCGADGPATYLFSDSSCSQSLSVLPLPRGCDGTTGQFFRCGAVTNLAGNLVWNWFLVLVLVVLMW